MTSEQVIEIPGCMHNAVNLYEPLVNAVEDHVGFDDKYSISYGPQLRVTGNASKVRMFAESSNSSVQHIDKCHSTRRAVECDELKNAQQVFLGGRKIAQGKNTGHGGVVVALPSSDGG